MSVNKKLLVKADRLCFRYQKLLVVNNISLRILKEDFLAIIGPNGGGKSTLIKLIVGFLQPQSGTITRHIKREHIGYVPQYVVRNHHFPASVREILAASIKRDALSFSRRSAKNISDILHSDSSLKALGIEQILDQQFVSCSTGQQQRVLIALALLHKPQLLILDEPTSGIDEKTKERFYDLLINLNTRQRIAIVLITHEVNILPPIVKQVLCINNRVHCYGALNELPAMLQQVYGDHAIHHHQDHHQGQ